MHKRVLFAALVAAVAVVCPSHATVTSTSSTASYTGNGATTAFAVPFKFQQNADLVVKVATVTKTLGVDYTVTGAGAASGTVTFTTAPANAAVILITRVVAYTQATSLRSQRTFDPSSIENALDKLTMQTQQLNAGISVSQNLTDASGATVTASGTSSSRTLAAIALDILNVRSCGAVLDGVTDDTTNINNCITAAPSGGVVFIPAGTAKLTGTGLTISKPLTLWMAQGAVLSSAGTKVIVVSGATGVKITGGTISLGTNISDQYAISPSGTVTDLTVDGVTITGQGTVPDGTHGVQTGFGNLSGQTLTNIKVRNCIISNVNAGISFNADLGGSINGCLAEDNHLTSIIGTVSGSGYGIHHANGSGNSSNCRIIHNEIDGAQRHSIYQAKGSGFLIAHNVIRNHRSGVGTGQNLPAIQVSRSRDGVVEANYFDQPTDGALSANPDLSTGATNVLRNVVYAKNVVVNPKGFPPISVGTQDPLNDGTPEELTYSENTVYNDTTVSGYSGDLIRIWAGKRLGFGSNKLYWLNATGSGGVISIRGTAEGAGTATYSDALNFTDNLLYSTNNGGTSFGFFWQTTAATSIIRAELNGNHVYTANNAHTFAAGQTDPNIIVNGMGQSSGLTLNLGSNGQITLTAGTGTATVPAGCKVICQDQTANASWKCDVSGTTLTATGTGTDVINYTCIR